MTLKFYHFKGSFKNDHQYNLGFKSEWPCHFAIGLAITSLKHGYDRFRISKKSLNTKYQYATIHEIRNQKSTCICLFVKHFNISEVCTTYLFLRPFWIYQPFHALKGTQLLIGQRCFPLSVSQERDSL